MLAVALTAMAGCKSDEVVQGKVSDGMVSHIWITSGDTTIKPFGRLMWMKQDNGDGTFSEMLIDTWDISNTLTGDGPTPLLDIPVLTLDGEVTYSVQANGMVEHICLYTPSGDSFIITNTRFEELSDLADGTYYVVFDVGLYGNCDPDAPQNSYLYEDVFCLVVE